MQAHPRNEDTIEAHACPLTRRKNTIKWVPTVKEGLGPDIEERGEGEGLSGRPLTSSSPCVTSEFRAALDTLFETLDETQPWFIFCINAIDSRLPDQLEGRSVKGQVKSAGLVEIAKRCMNKFEVNMTPEKFCERYWEGFGGWRYFGGRCS